MSKKITNTADFDMLNTQTYHAVGGFYCEISELCKAHIVSGEGDEKEDYWDIGFLARKVFISLGSREVCGYDWTSVQGIASASYSEITEIAELSEEDKRTWRVG